MTPTDELLHEARVAAGLENFGEPTFLEPLTRWAHDLDQPLLSSSGRAFLRRIAVNNLRTRLQVADLLDRHPDIADVELPPVVLIAGFARSGTTLLHNLLSCHPGTRAFQRWELMRPVPPPTSEAWSTDRRRTQVQASVDTLRGSELERLHWVNASEPEECPWGFYDCRGLLGRGVGVLMPSWWDHVLEHRSSSTFVEYRSLLQLLLWKNPPPPGAVLVLKSPMTTHELADFDAAFPSARYVFTHRDPFRVVVSMNAVGDAIAAPLRVPGTWPPADDSGEARGAMRIVAAAVESMMSFASANPDRIAHVQYPELMADAAGTVTSTFERLGIDAGEGVTDRVDAFLSRQRAERAAPPPAYKHSYTAEDVWSNAAVQAYSDAFDVAPETERLTEPSTRRSHA